MRMSQLVPPKFGGNLPVRTAGTIRPGIRRLTNKGRENPQAVKIYQEGVASNESFRQIEERVFKATGGKFLTPSNPAYFTVRPADFEVPEMAEKILNNYGVSETIESVTTRVVKRLPISLVSDDIEGNFDVSYKCFTGSGLKYWADIATESDEKANGIAAGTRICRKFEEVPKSDSGKTLRMPAGRPVGFRGLCEPTKCPQYQSGECSMRGKLYFHVPGINVSAPLEMPIGSKTFCVEADETLAKMREATGGNLTRFEQPVFFLTKQERMVASLDDDGKPVQRKQNIVVLEAMVDIPKLRLVRNQPLDTLRADQSAVFLGQVAPTEVALAESNSVPEEVQNAEHTLPRLMTSIPDAIDEPNGPIPQAQRKSNPLQQSVGEAARVAGFENTDRIKLYAVQLFGTGWVKNESALTALATHLNEIASWRNALLLQLKKSGLTLDQMMQDDPEPPFWDFDQVEIQKRLNP
jgi:Recombination directionality factor-like